MRSSRRLRARQSIVPSESGSKAITTRSSPMTRARSSYQLRVARSAAGPPPWYFGPQPVAWARSTVKIGTSPRARAGSIRRRTLTAKLGRVKRPSQSALGWLAMRQTRFAWAVLPLRMR